MRSALGAVFLLVLVIPAAAQTTTYSYTGDPYTSATAPYAVGGNITGTFTTASPLPAFLPFGDISASLETFSFSDGVATRTQASSFICAFNVATDGAGNITRWQVFLRQSPYTTGNPQHSIDSSGLPTPPEGIDLVGTGPANADPCGIVILNPAASTASQGTWTDTNPLPTQPTVYNYTGDPFTAATAPYAVGGRVTGTITTANPLPAFLPLTDIIPSLVSLTFMDGVQTRTLANSFLCSFRVATDGNGNITEWEVFLRQSPYTPGNPQQSIESSGRPVFPEGADIAGTGIAGASPCDPFVLTAFGSAGSQGTWTGEATAVGDIPALDRFGLLALMGALAGLALLVMRR